MCAYLAAVYLTQEASRRGDHRLQRYFARRAALSGAISGALSLATLLEVRTSNPALFHGLTHRALPLVILAAGCGLAVVALLATGRSRGLRALSVLGVTAVVFGWGVAQYPALLPGTGLTLAPERRCIRSSSPSWWFSSRPSRWSSRPSSCCSRYTAGNCSRRKSRRGKADAMSIFDEPKIDCHNHVFDPARFEFSPEAYYFPVGAELGTRSQLTALFEAYGVQRALVIQPNSGYGDDNRCLIDVLARGEGRFRGMAIVANDVSRRELERLRALRIGGVTFNAALLGVEYYSKAAGLLAELAELGMFVDLQVQADQLVDMLPLLEATDARVVVDHCGRPRPGAGLDQPGFAALLRLAATGRVFVKISGYAKFSAQSYPYRDAWPYVQSLIQSFGADRCVWGSDWPFLRAPERIDYGPLLKLIEHLVPEPAERSKLLWHTPNRLFGFADPPRLLRTDQSLRG